MNLDWTNLMYGRICWSGERLEEAILAVCSIWLSTRLGVKSTNWYKKCCKKKHQNKTTDWMLGTKKKIRKGHDNFKSSQRTVMDTRGEAQEGKWWVQHLFAEFKNMNIFKFQDKTKLKLFLVFSFNSKVVKSYIVEYRSIPEISGDVLKL